DALTGELLEGMNFATSPAFEGWLAVERAQLGATAQALLLERAQAELGAGNAGTAARLATRLLELNPLEEGHHELLIRSLVATGDKSAAFAGGEACEGRLRGEPGVSLPSPLPRTSPLPEANPGPTPAPVPPAPPAKPRAGRQPS